MNVGPYPPSQPGSGSDFGFDNAAAYPTYPYQAASYHGVTPQPRASQAFAPIVPQGGYDGGHAAMASTGGSMMLAQAAGQQYPYTTVPYSQSVPAQAPTGPAQQQQQQALRHTLSASPQQRQSPNAGSQLVPPQQQTPPNIYPMAAPPLPQSPANQQQAVAQNASPSPQTPQSPGSQSREQQRVALLLEINLEMLQEVNRLQMEGKGGATTPQIQAQMKAAGQPADLASEEYIQVLRRVQSNLGYLMPVAQNDTQKTPRGPAYMSPPPHMPQLQPKFDQLKELFPDWQGIEHRTSQSSASPKPNSMNAANGLNNTATPPVQT